MSEVMFLHRCKCGKLLTKPELNESMQCECGEQWSDNKPEDKQLDFFKN